jgi:hypothetical protein
MRKLRLPVQQQAALIVVSSAFVAFDRRPNGIIPRRTGRSLADMNISSMDKLLMNGALLLGDGRPKEYHKLRIRKG